MRLPLPLPLASANLMGMLRGCLLTPMMTVSLAKAGASPWLVGLFAATTFGVILLTLPLPTLIRRRWGSLLTYRVNVLLSLVAVSLLWVPTKGLMPMAVAYFTATALMGLGGGLIWGVVEGEIARHVPSDRVGRLTGIYQTGIGGMMMVGPFLPWWLGWTPQQTLLAATGLSIAAVGAVWLPTHPSPVDHTATPPPHVSATVRLIWQAARMMPFILVSALICGLFEAGLNAIITLIGLANALPTNQASALPGWIALGSFVAQYPMGWMADRLGVGPTLKTAFVLLIVAALCLLGVHHGPWLLTPIALVWGVGGGGLYTLNIVTISKETSQPGHPVGLEPATAAMVASYTVGAVGGSMVTTTVYTRAGDLGVAVFIVGCCALALLSLQQQPTTTTTLTHGDISSDTITTTV